MISKTKVPICSYCGMAIDDLDSCSVDCERHIRKFDAHQCPVCYTVLNWDEKECTVCTGKETVIPQNLGRTFDTGATRDTAEGKLDYSRALAPEVLKRYVEYLDKHRKQSDGEMRSFDNWKKGMPIKDAYMPSMFRHFHDVWTHVMGELGPEPGEELEECLCALKFNVDGLLYEVLRERLSNA